MRALIALTKPRIIELLLVTTVPTMLLAQRGVPSIRLVLVTLIGGTLAAGSANTINCYIDRDIDQLMKRTSRRPTAAHTISARSVFIFGAILTVVSLSMMAAFTNWLATALTAAAKTIRWAWTQLWQN